MSDPANVSECEMDSSDAAFLRAVIGTAEHAHGIALAPGMIVDGKYRITRKLGSGGMGIVYLARDLKLQRDIAIKVHAATNNSEGTIRLQREATAMAQLSHPHVVTVYEVGTFQGHPFVAMEYVDGGTLATWLAEAPRSWQEVLDVYLAAGRGLAAAHQEGLVHRDFKPANVLIGKDRRIRVADFGLVQAGAAVAVAMGDSVDGDAAPLTQTGAVVGTPAYMAPEQRHGGVVTARVDQFAFAVSLWEGVYGERPIGADGRRREPSGGRRIPSALRRALEVALADDPEQRYPGMLELLARLERLRRGRRGVWAGLAAAVVIGAAVAIAMRLASGEAPSSLIARCEPAVAPDLWVDATAAPGGTGAPGCPLRTITAALVTELERKVIHVAAGRYTESSGERFPLEVRGMVTIEGVDTVQTIVEGVGYHEPVEGGTLANAPYFATFRVGDADATIVIRNLSIHSGSHEPLWNRYGVVCTRGNLATFMPPVPAANTVLQRITLGPGYGAAVVAATETRGLSSGCNLLIEDAAVADALFGVWQVGCGSGQGRIPTGLTVRRTTFSGMRSSRYPEAAGLSIWDCHYRVQVEDSHFIDSDNGIRLVRHGDAPEAHSVMIERSSFERLAGVGVGIYRSAIVHRLAGNHFAEVRRSSGDAAIAIDIDGIDPGEPPRVVARSNVIAENDAGVRVRLHGGPGAPMIDFGRRGDPGDNTLGCNRSRRAVPGFDVAVSGPGPRSWFAGNRWEHAPPRSSEVARSDGIDVVVSDRDAIDVADPALMSCATPLPAPTKATDASDQATDLPGHLVVNGSFEQPRLGVAAWNAFAAIPGWQRSAGIAIELQQHPIDKAAGGAQHAELDSYGSSTIYQDVPTRPQARYRLQYAFAARPGTAIDNNRLEVWWNGARVDAVAAAGAAGRPRWLTRTVEVVATGTSTRLELRDVGISDTLGTFVDSVELVELAR